MECNDLRPPSVGKGKAPEARPHGANLPLVARWGMVPVPPWTGGGLTYPALSHAFPRVHSFMP